MSSIKHDHYATEQLAIAALANKVKRWAFAEDTKRLLVVSASGEIIPFLYDHVVAPVQQSFDASNLEESQVTVADDTEFLVNQGAVIGDFTVNLPFTSMKEIVLVIGNMAGFNLNIYAHGGNINGSTERYAITGGRLVIRLKNIGGYDWEVVGEPPVKSGWLERSLCRQTTPVTLEGSGEAGIGDLFSNLSSARRVGTQTIQPSDLVIGAALKGFVEFFAAVTGSGNAFTIDMKANEEFIEIHTTGSPTLSGTMRFRYEFDLLLYDIDSGMGFFRGYIRMLDLTTDPAPPPITPEADAENGEISFDVSDPVELAALCSLAPDAEGTMTLTTIRADLSISKPN